MNPESSVVIRTYVRLSDADLAAARLSSAGIECSIATDDAGGGYPALSPIRLSVHADEFEDAERVLISSAEAGSWKPIDDDNLLENRPPPPQPPFAKFGWGMLVGAICGVLFHWGYLKSEQIGRHTFRYDNDKDGVPDEEHVWEDGVISASRFDHNGDSRIDFWSYFENGVRTREELDCNFDGRPDVWFTAGPRGDYINSRFDSDFDGRADAFTSFVHGQASQTDWRPGETNVTILRQVFEKGVLREELRDTDGNGLFDVSVRYDAFNTPVSTNFLELLSKPPAVR